MPGLARGGNAVPLTERSDRRCAASAAPAARSGRRLVCRQRAGRHAAAGERRRRPHRLQDRHLLRLSRRLGGRLRRQAHHRRLGRAAGRRAGAGPGRARGRGADPVRRLRAHRRDAGRRCRRRRRARCSPTSGKLPPPLQRFRPNGVVAGDSASRRCASCSRRTARGSNSRPYDGKPDPVALKIAGGVEPLTVLVNGVPAAARAERRTLFVDARRAGLRAADRDRRHAARPTASWSGCNNARWACSLRHRGPFPWFERRCNVPPGRGRGELAMLLDHRTYTVRVGHAAQAARALREARLCRAEAPFRRAARLARQRDRRRQHLRPYLGLRGCGRPQPQSARRCTRIRSG